MADFTETPDFVPVPILTAADPVDATNEDSPANKQALALVKRTAALKEQLDAIELTVVGGSSEFLYLADSVDNGSFGVANPLGTTSVAIDIHPMSDPAGTWGEWWATYAADFVTVRTSGTYTGTVRWTLRRTTLEV